MNDQTTGPAKPQPADSRPSISRMIRRMISSDDVTGRKIIAGAINLYTLANQGKMVKSWTHDDVSKLFIITDILLTTYEGSFNDIVGEKPPIPAGRPLRPDMTLHGMVDIPMGATDEQDAAEQNRIF